MKEEDQPPKKIKYYSNIELGNDIDTQINLIAQGTRELLIAWSILASEIVVSQERVIDGLDYLSTSSDEVKDGISGLKSMFDFSILEIIWQIEKKKPAFRKIHKILTFNLDDLQKKLRKRADKYYELGFTEKAEEDLVSSAAINEYDFSIYISLGLIYLFHKDDLDEALFCFDDAIKYAKSKSAYYTSFALMIKAHILFNNELIIDAKQCLEEAVALSPDIHELFYQLSIIEAQLNKEKAILLIIKLLNFDIRYSLKIENESAFDIIREDIHKIYQEMIDSQSTEIMYYHNNVSLAINKILEDISNCQTIVEMNKKFIPEDMQLNHVMQRIVELIDRKSLLDVYTAGMILKNEVISLFEDFKKFATSYIDSGLEILEQEKAKINAEYLKKKNKYFIYSINKGIKSILIYLLIYGMTWFAFDNIIIAVLIATLPFTIIWYLNYVNFTQRTNLIKTVEDKTSQLVAMKNSF